MPDKGTEIVVDIDLYLYHETPKGILVSPDRDERRGKHNQVWLPKGVVEFVVKSRNLITITMPTWLAYEKGLI